MEISGVCGRTERLSSPLMVLSERRTDRLCVQIRHSPSSLTHPPPPLSDCFQLFLNPRLSCKTKDGSKYVGRFVASLRRAFHFSGVDELLCSYFNSQHPIIGHHLGLSFLLPSPRFSPPLSFVSP